MSDTNFLEKLLDGVAVEWKALGELDELVRGNGLQKKDFTETGVPAIHYGQIYTYYGLSTTETKSFVSSALAKQLRKVDRGDVEKESDKKAFTKLFGEYLRIENVLQNYDEFTSLRALQTGKFRITDQPTTTFVIDCAVKNQPKRKKSPALIGTMWFLK